MAKEKSWTTGIDSSRQERILTVTDAGRVQIVRINPWESSLEIPEFRVEDLGSDEKRRLVQRMFGSTTYDEVVAYAQRRFGL